MNANQNLKNNCRNNGSPFITRRNKGNSPGNRKKDRNRTSPKRNSPKHRQNYLKKTEKSVDDLIILTRDELNFAYDKNQQSLIKCKVLDENLLNGKNESLSSSNDSVATLKNEDCCNTADFNKSPVHKITTKDKIVKNDNNTSKAITNDTDHCKSTITLSPNGDHISIVSTVPPSNGRLTINPRNTTQPPSLRRCQSVHSHCDNELAKIASVKNRNRNSCDSIIITLNDNDNDMLNEVERSKLHDSYAQKLNDSLDLMLKDADPAELIYERGSHTHGFGVDSARRPQTHSKASQHSDESTIQPINDSYKFKDVTNKSSDLLSISQKVSKTAKRNKHYYRHTWCYLEQDEEEELSQNYRDASTTNTDRVQGVADKCNNNGTSRYTRNTLAGNQVVNNTRRLNTQDTSRENTASVTSQEMGEIHRVMRRYRPKPAQNSSVIRPRSELLESTKEYERRATDSCRLFSGSKIRPASMYELNGRVNILQSAAIQHHQMQQQLNPSSNCRDSVLYQRDNNDQQSRSKYATMRPLSLSSVEDTMSVLEGYTALSRSKSCSKNKTKRPKSVASSQQILRNNMNTTTLSNCKSEMHLTSWPTCPKEFVIKYQRQSLPQDFDSKWRNKLNNQNVNIADLECNANKSTTHEQSRLNDRNTNPSTQCSCKQCNCTQMIPTTASRANKVYNTNNPIYQNQHPGSNGSSCNHSHMPTCQCSQCLNTVSNVEKDYICNNKTVPLPEPNLIDLSDPFDICNDVPDQDQKKSSKTSILKSASRTTVSVMTDAMRYTSEKLMHRSIEDLYILLENFYKQTQAVSEELVELLQVRHNLQEQLAMRQIAVDQLARLAGETAPGSKTSTIASLPPGGDPVTGIVVSDNDLEALRQKLEPQGKNGSGRMMTVPDRNGHR